MTHHKVYIGDAKEVLKSLPERSIDCVITSPPYNVGIDYGVYKDNLSFDEYYAFMREIIKELYRVLKDDGRVCWNIPIEVNYPKRYSPLAMFWNIFIEEKFKHFGIILWYDETRTKNSAWGSFASPSCPFIYTPHEVILLFYKRFSKKSNRGKSDITNNEFCDWVRGTWKIQPKTIRNTPSDYPEEIPKRCIKLMTYINDTILDPFAGSGTTGVVAKQLHRNSIQIEINPGYVYNIIISRMNFEEIRFNENGDIEQDTYEVIDIYDTK